MITFAQILVPPMADEKGIRENELRI